MLKIEIELPVDRDRPGKNFNISEGENDMKEIFCRFIRKNGKIIYPKNGKLFHFFVDEEKGPSKTGA